jgi:ERF superfamily
MTDTGGNTEPRKTIYTALLAFQADCPVLIKDKKAEIVSKRTGGKFSYKFIPLPNIMETIQPLLSKHGLIWSTSPCYWGEGDPALSYTLIYAPTGEKIEDTMPLILGKEPDSRAHGSALSYARRQALEAVLNLVAQTDDDGARASSPSKQPQGDAKPVGVIGRRKVQEAIAEAGKDERGLLTAVGLEKIEDLTVGSAKAIRQILDAGKK